MFQFVEEKEYKDYVNFNVDEDSYCISVEKVQEIIFVPPISKIPNVPNFIDGAINLRGKIVQIVNLRKWLSLPWAPISPKSRILIIEYKNSLFGLLVDSVNEVFKINNCTQFSVPGIISDNLDIDYIQSIISNQDQLIIEIKPEKIK